MGHCYARISSYDPPVALPDLSVGRAFPGAEPPRRSSVVDSSGVSLTVHEWGEEHDPVIVLVHGGGDFARTFDVLAPKLAARGLRPVAWDHRGHGDSAFAHYYGWDADARDGCAVIRSLGAGPVAILGHSKGGMVATAIAGARPDLVSHLANLDGFPMRPDYPVGPHDEMIGFRMAEMHRWLDRRRRDALVRRAGTLTELATRRQENSRRLPLAWLEYLVAVGAREDDDGWRWKGDPAISQLLHNPVRLHWPLQQMPGLGMPVLAVLGLVRETRHMGSTPEDIAEFLPPQARLVPFEDSGHFVHIEHPDRVVDLVVELLA